MEPITEDSKELNKIETREWFLNKFHLLFENDNQEKS